MNFLKKMTLGVTVSMIAAGGCIASASSVSAEGAGGSPYVKREGHDGAKRKPIEMTREQALSRASKKFDAADKNSDGVLSRDEIRKSRDKNHKNGKSHGKGMFNKIDADDSGSISKVEMETFGVKADHAMDGEKLSKRFIWMDKDKSGDLSKEEFKGHKKHKKMAGKEGEHSDMKDRSEE